MISTRSPLGDASLTSDSRIVILRNMRAELLAISGFFWLSIFMAFGLIINKLRGKPTINGALAYCWVVAALTAIFVIAALLKPAIQELVIEWIAGMFFSYVVAFVFARKYMKRTGTLPINARDA